MPYNLERANKFMEEYKIDVLIATEPITLKYLEYNIWLSSFKEWNFKPGGSNYPGLVSFCIIPYKKIPVYILNSQTIGFLKDIDINNVIPYGNYTNIEDKTISREFENRIDFKISEIHKRAIFSDPLEAIEYYFKENNLQNSRVAIEKIGLNPDLFNNIKDRFGYCDFKDGTEIFRLIRMVKVLKEIELLKQSVDIAEEAFLSSLNLLKINKLFGEARKEFKRIVCSHNAFLNHYVIFSRGLGFKENSDYKIEKNSTIAFDFGCMSENYICDTAATVFVGKVSQNSFEIYKQLIDILETGLNKIKPGVRCSEVYDAMINKRDHYNLFNCSPEGHGVGINHHEYPKIGYGFNYYYNDGFTRRSGDFIIEKDMVINIEVPTHFHNESSYSIEKTVYITGDGFKEISIQNREKPIIV
ncbi:MAG: aminopeptidase P family protein [Actinobacteria bacterium]|nr:aminopeptidase P family protein [Actinomycetota bacterium]MBM3712001.1 aminopeptidase P family protein [Actinomycetota bacterium]